MSDENTTEGGGEDPWADALKEQEAAEGAAGGAEEDPWGDALAEQKSSEGMDEHPLAELETLAEDTTIGGLPADHPDLDIILDIPVTISMEVGSTTISIRNLLHLNQGSVVELDRYAGEPLDVLVNGTLVAHGEVVVVNEKFGIRLTDIMSAAERVKKIGELG